MNSIFGFNVRFQRVFYTIICNYFEKSTKEVFRFILVGFKWSDLGYLFKLIGVFRVRIIFLFLGFGFKGGFSRSFGLGVQEWFYFKKGV